MTEYFKKDGDKYEPVEDNLLTQADVDRLVETRLERQRKQFADYDDLKDKASKVDSVAKEYEDKLKAAGEATSAVQAELNKAKLETVKVKTIHEFKLSDELAEFVNGEDEASIRQQAEKLAKGVTGSPVVIDKTPKPGEKTSDTKKVAQNLFGKKSGD
jgi:hypothetical protein